MNTLLIPEIRQTLARRDCQSIREFAEDLHPATVAEFVGDMEPADLNAFLACLPPLERGEVFSYLEVPTQVRLAHSLKRDQLAELVTHMSPDERADLVKRLKEETLEALWPALAQAEREDIRRLSSYEEGTAGSVMTSDYVTLLPHLTARESIEKIRREAPDRETVYYAYVITPERRLIGSVSLKDLILAPASARVEAVMSRDPILVRVDADQEEVALEIGKYDLLAIPVVDAEGRMMGIVTVDDVVDLVQEAATEDIQKLGGMEALDAPYLDTSFVHMVRKRAGWLAALFLGEMLTATAMGHFEDEIARAVVLALFVPLIISSGGNAGSQASTLVIRAMALNEVSLRDWWRVARRELVSGLALGTVLGSVGFLRVVLWEKVSPTYGEHYVLIAATIAVSLVGVVTFGTLAGSLLPFVLRRLGLDPASASAPFVATMVDVTGLLIYFSAASVILSGALL
ncbi:MAG: magnesium transporter [Proteobacteria bacterium]|nr:magnesium transporter [Pseudomonadota bacterium]